MLPLAFALLCAQLAPEDVGFQTPPTEVLVARRLETRARFAAAVIGAASTGAGFGVGVGLQLEGGLTLDDHISLAVRGTAASIGFAVDLGGALGVDFLLNELFSLGIGVGSRLYAFVEAPAGISVGVPLRAQFHPFRRGGAQVHRSSFLISLEAMPAIAVHSWGGRFGPSPTPAAAFSGMLSIGYAWW